MKNWYTSKTIWFAVLYGVVSLAGLIGFADYRPDSETLEIVGIIVAVATVLLRKVTVTAIR